jgi:hypothetical protein
MDEARGPAPISIIVGMGARSHALAARLNQILAVVCPGRQKLRLIAGLFTLIILIFGVATSTNGQNCAVAGAYRIDVAASDKLYSVIMDATNRLPSGEQQQSFTDLSVRLAPPDLLGIECEGRRVTIGSSRAEKLTFTADGSTRQERSASGNIVNSRIMLDRDTLVFTVTGKVDDRFNIVFRSIDNGNRLRVTRQVYSDQLSQPVVFNTIYLRISNNVDWNAYGGAPIAKQPGKTADSPRTKTTVIISDPLGQKPR